MALSAELRTRAISGIILGAAVLFITWWHPTSFMVMCAMGGYILAREWWRLTRGRSRWFILLGLVYIGLPLAALIVLRQMDAILIFQLFALVWSCDIGGYFVGKKLGQHKIAPSISPGKSWEGLAGSITACSITAYLVLKTPYLLANGELPFPGYPVFALVVGVLFAIVGLAGDLFESSLKRRAGVKDSGTLIPGHGGLFDRVDALLPCTLVMYVLQMIFIATALGRMS